MQASSSQELLMREDDFIVSKTDTHGMITYGNRTFIEFSGYPERELLGAPHSLIRHPDMPRAVFRLLWETIQARQEFFGYVKNRHRDGRFYWTFANVTASVDQSGQVVGYYSVRRKPSREAIERLMPIYTEAREAELAASGEASVQAGMDVLDWHIQNNGGDYHEFVLAL